MQWQHWTISRQKMLSPAMTPQNHFLTQEVAPAMTPQNHFLTQELAPAMTPSNSNLKLDVNEGRETWKSSTPSWFENTAQVLHIWRNFAKTWICRSSLNIQPDLAGINVIQFFHPEWNYTITVYDAIYKYFISLKDIHRKTFLCQFILMCNAYYEKNTENFY